MRRRGRQGQGAPEEGMVCIRCPHSEFLDPTREICYKTGGLRCKVLDIVVGKYEPCRLGRAGRGRRGGG